MIWSDDTCFLRSSPIVRSPGGARAGGLARPQPHCTRDGRPRGTAGRSGSDHLPVPRVTERWLGCGPVRWARPDGRAGAPDPAAAAAVGGRYSVVADSPQGSPDDRPDPARPRAGAASHGAGTPGPVRPPGTPVTAPEPPSPSEIAPSEGAAPELPIPDAAQALRRPVAVGLGGDAGARKRLAWTRRPWLPGRARLGVVIGATGLALSTGAIGAAAPSPTPAPTAAPTAEPTAPPVGNTFGRPDAPVTIEVWADYQCPYCRLEDLLFGGAIDREYVTPGIARVVYRDFAFLGQESIDAAVAARCAGAQDPAAQLRYHDSPLHLPAGREPGPLRAGEPGPDGEDRRRARPRQPSRPASTTPPWPRPWPTRRRRAATLASPRRRRSGFAGPAASGS